MHQIVSRYLDGPKERMIPQNQSTLLQLRSFGAKSLVMSQHGWTQGCVSHVLPFYGLPSKGKERLPRRLPLWMQRLA